MLCNDIVWAYLSSVQASYNLWIDADLCDHIKRFNMLQPLTYISLLYEFLVQFGTLY